MSAILADTKALIDREMPLYVLCAVACSILVLFLSLKGTVVPFVFMLGIAFPIVYNFGTNYFLGQILHYAGAGHGPSAGCNHGLFHFPAAPL